MRSAYMSLFAEAQGSMGVVLNGPTPIETIKMVDEAIDIPIISTVTSIHTPIDEKLAAGVDMINMCRNRHCSHRTLFPWQVSRITDYCNRRTN